MWYIAHTTAGRELDAVDKCRKSIPEDIAARVFSPIWQHAANSARTVRLF